MSTVHEIERAITTLKPEELTELLAWMEEHHPQLTDSRIASDLNAGRLDHLILAALEDEREGRLKPL